jgi:CBS domain containing-hemolysin-like protein
MMELAALVPLLLLLSGFFSATELAVTMASRVRLRTRAADGQRLAQAAVRLLRRRERAIALCLVGNTVVNVALAVAGREVLVRLVPMGEAFVDALAAAVVVLLLLVFGEILPKAVAQNYPNRILMANVLPLLGLRLLLAPAYFLAMGVADLVKRAAGSRRGVLEFVSREEIKQFVARSEQRGHVDADERRLVERIVEFWKLDPQNFVRPLHAVPRVTLAATAGEAKELMRAARVTRLPVTDPEGRDVVGVLSAAGLLDADNDGALSRRLARPVRAEPGVGLDRLLSELQKSPSQMAIVAGPDGAGIILLDDLLHALLGEPGSVRDKNPLAAVPGRS